MFKKEVSNEEIRDLLVQLMVRLDSLEEEVKKVSKHVPFVDHLANSGAVRAVTGLNRIMAGLNPTNFLPALPVFPAFLVRHEIAEDGSAEDESAEDTEEGNRAHLAVEQPAAGVLRVCKRRELKVRSAVVVA